MTIFDPARGRVIDTGTSGGNLLRLIALAVAAFFIVILLFASVTRVGTGHVGVLTLFGRVTDETLGEGIHLINQSLEKAGRVADFFELAELMCIDALHREESAGGHFRVEYQTAEGEALRNDDKFLYVAAWEFTGVGNEPRLHKEPLVYEEVKLAARSYK